MERNLPYNYLVIGFNALLGSIQHKRWNWRKYAAFQVCILFVVRDRDHFFQHRCCFWAAGLGDENKRSDPVGAGRYPIPGPVSRTDKRRHTAGVGEGLVSRASAGWKQS